MSALPSRGKRVWINQPSTQQPLHHLHGSVGIAYQSEKDEKHGMIEVHLFRNDVISIRCNVNDVTDGWPKKLPDISETSATLAIKELIQLTDKEARMEGDNLYGNPTHCHTVRGKWDRDGSVCKSCEAWDKVREVAARSLEEPSDGK